MKLKMMRLMMQKKDERKRKSMRKGREQGSNQQRPRIEEITGTMCVGDHAALGVVVAVAEMRTEKGNGSVLLAMKSCSKEKIEEQGSTSF